ncbi:head decoration protein [Rhizobium sp. 268]|uniref:head decoration protein n=1 Tax=Rhizobium sp. 268 TaxID=2996375 RepID=UPI002F93E5F3
MPYVLTQGAADEAFLHGDERSGRSRDIVTLAAGTYASGSVVISDGGNYQLATQALVDADVDGNAKYGIVCRNVSGSAPFKAAAVVREASVKSSELVTGAGLTVAEVAPLLAKAHVIVRETR